MTLTFLKSVLTIKSDFDRQKKFLALYIVGNRNVPKIDYFEFKIGQRSMKNGTTDFEFEIKIFTLQHNSDRDKISDYIIE